MRSSLLVWQMGLTTAIFPSRSSDSVGYREYLFQAVRYVYHADALPDQRADEVEKTIQFMQGQGGRRFIHHYDPGLGRDGFGYFDHLSLGHTQARDRRLRTQIQPEFCHHPNGRALQRRLIDEPAEPAGPGAYRFSPQHDVLADAKVRHESEVLVYYADAQILGLPGLCDLDHTTVQLHLPGVFGFSAGKDLDQCGFACAVLANERMHLAAAQVEIHFIQRGNARVPLGDSAHLQDVLRQCILPP